MWQIFPSNSYRTKHITFREFIHFEEKHTLKKTLQTLYILYIEKKIHTKV